MTIDGNVLIESGGTLGQTSNTGADNFGSLTINSGENTQQLQELLLLLMRHLVDILGETMVEHLLTIMEL